MMGITPLTMYYLEGIVHEIGKTWRTPIGNAPFRIGRRPDADLVLRSVRVSHLHAEIHRSEGALWLIDLDSTNGTFVNGRRVVNSCLITDGDVIHFADHEFRLIVLDHGLLGASDEERATLSFTPTHAPDHVFEQARDFREMFQKRGIYTHFQPIVNLSSAGVVGFEALGRGVLGGREALAGELFGVAEAMEMELDLSAALRERSLVEAAVLNPEQPLYMNTHPAELRNEERFFSSLISVRERFPKRLLVLEIHERAVADLASFERIRRRLEELEFVIAFDDFGTGEARLLELIDIEPYCVKFDRAWISAIDQSSERRRTLVEGLVRILSDMRVTSVAEGVETPAEAAVCRELGFDLAQGYHFGRPSPARTFNF